MGKSLGNALAVTELTKTVRPLVLRHYLGAAHYRSTIEYGDDSLDEALAAVERIEGYVVRAREVLGGAIGLLEEIAHDTDSAGDPPLLAAIADGTFGLMRRPPDGGRGLDGVAKKSKAYYNPASEILEERP